VNGVVLIVSIVLLAAGAGAGYTFLVAPTGRPVAPLAALETGVRPATLAKQAGETSRELVLPLEPLLANFDGTRKFWIRLESAVVFQTAPSNSEQQPLLRQIGEDLLLALRSTPVTQFESAAGLEFLRDDFADLVSLRTGGRARKLVIKSLVIE
jgi:flagellar FliL protein